jgi:hypothetical protein
MRLLPHDILIRKERDLYRVVPSSYKGALKLFYDIGLKIGDRLFAFTLADAKNVKEILSDKGLYVKLEE